MSILKQFTTKLKEIVGKDFRGDLLKQMPKNSVCAEIGVWKGAFTKRVLKEVQPAKLHLIDPWKYQTSFGKRLYGGSVAQSQEDMDAIYQQVVDDLSKSNCVEFHREFSNKAASAFEADYFDWVYVDGNHYYEYVLEDLNKFAPKIKKGGFLTGDDYLWTSPELNGDKPVLRAVEDFLDGDKNFELFKIFKDQFILKKVSDI